MNVYIENAKIWHYPFIRYYIKRGYTIYIFDFDFKMREKKWWLRNLIDEGLVYTVSHYMTENHRLALNNIEDVYRSRVMRSRLMNSLMKIYEDSAIELAYKKVFAEKLSNFYAVWIMLKEGETEIPQGEKIILIPDNYYVILKILRQCRANVYELRSVFVPFWAYCVSFVNRLFVKMLNVIRFYMVSFLLSVVVLCKISLSFAKRKIKSYHYAIAIINSGFQFKFKTNRTFDFLLDSKKIKRDNTVFIILSFLDSAMRRKLRSEAYNIIDCRFGNVLKLRNFSVSMKIAVDIVKKILSNWFRNVFYVFCEKDVVVYSSSVLLLEYARWRVVLENIRFTNFIIFNNETMRHVARNSLLRKYSCKTWMYAHSCSFNHVYALNDNEMEKYRNWLWAYLFYDYYVAWDRRMIEYQKLHMQRIGNYVNAGCIWSSFVEKNSRKDFSVLLERNNIHKTIDKDYKIISIFDTSYMEGIGSDYSLKHGIKFCNDILKLLDDNSNFFVIVKQKKPESWYSSKKSFVYSPYNKEYSEVLRNMEKHSRACLVRASGDPSEIINYADLVITYVFSSPTVEALCGHKKAIYYDPTGKLRGYYDNIPDLVAHNYEKLNELVNKLLYDITDQEYGEYLNTFVRGKIEDYLDGKALDRFREQL